ncbi:MAG: hypothetical protein Q7V01_07185 [Vicinamibacterales bacterium]|nr:hypothetical protein [Vicinamibacterales bacterium]
MNEPVRGQTNAVEDYQDDEISLRPYMETLWKYRKVILAALAAAAVVFFVGVIGLSILYPTERVATVKFRLLFDGAAQNEYPNKAPFSPTEIVGAPVVTEVYKTNNLEQYGPYERFKDALFIQQSNPQLDLLAYEYQAKLADTKLTPVDRARIEEEFNRKRDALIDPVFSLTLRRSERFRSLPRDLAEKVLGDTLAGWALQAERMGAMKYQVPVLSSIILPKETFEKEDYLVAADMLRAKAVRIIGTINELEEIPGALTIRTSKDKISLPEIRANIEDALRFELEPLLGIIRSEGVTRNARLLSMYASNQLFQLRLEKDTAEGRARAVRESLQEYMSQRVSRGGTDSRLGGSATRQPGLDTPALIPQFGESFLDRLVEMSAQTQTSEVAYRQRLTDQVIEETTKVAELEKELAYYEDLAKSISGIGGRPSGSPELVALIKARSQAAFAVVAKATDQISDLYAELSRQNLNPVARLYAITGPFTQHTSQSLAFRSVLLSFVLVMMLTLIVVPAGCLIHNAVRKKAA